MRSTFAKDALPIASINSSFTSTKRAQASTAQWGGNGSTTERHPFSRPIWYWLNLVDAIHLTKQLQNNPICAGLQFWIHVPISMHYTYYIMQLPLLVGNRHTSWQICCLSISAMLSRKKIFATTLPIIKHRSLDTSCSMIESVQGFHLWRWSFLRGRTAVLDGCFSYRLQ